MNSYVHIEKMYIPHLAHWQGKQDLSPCMFKLDGHLFGAFATGDKCKVIPRIKGYLAKYLKDGIFLFE